uniref:Ferredoxin-thioredoxin reductase catalytic chain, chloroplastic n=1 Tax=Anthurium amnicola TaxID=1678845 RepID=A0A1D1ZGF9_9ARAE
MEMASVMSSGCTSLRGFGLPSCPPASSPVAATAAGALPARTRHCSRLVVRAKVEPSEKSVDVMRKFSEQYARRSGTYFCVDKGVTAVVIKGLAEHRDSLGAPLCPCRHYDDKAAEVGQGFWNCPCVPMRERKECHCMLFLTPDNDFAGTEQVISLDEIKETTSNL